MSIAILRGDARSLPLPDASVDLICTSPPYWNLRDYRDGGESLDGQIGAEPTPREYLDALIECTAEWGRVLKPSGSIFVVLGDKYANDAKWGGATSGKHVAALHGKTGIGRAKALTGFPAKSLMDLPARYAIRCVDELGLVKRAEIVWSKVNPTPESTKDRVRRSHEMIFHFTREGRYYSATDEIREQYAPGTSKRYAAGYNDRAIDGKRLGIGVKLGGDTYDENPLGKLPGSVWEITGAGLVVPERIAHAHCCGRRQQAGCKDGLDHHAAYPPELVRRIALGWSPPGICTACGEGRRPVASVASMADRPGRRQQITDSALAATHGPDGRGGERWRHSVRITGYACACTPFTDHPERRGKDFHDKSVSSERGTNDGNGGERYRRYVENLAAPRGPVREYHLDAWVAPPARQAVILDPFSGTGTSLLVADVLGRHAIGIDRSADYCHLARWRTTDPGERARAMQVPKPPAQSDDQLSLFSIEGAAS